MFERFTSKELLGFSVVLDVVILAVLVLNLIVLNAHSKDHKIFYNLLTKRGGS